MSWLLLAAALTPGPEALAAAKPAPPKLAITGARTMK